jgi:hypothetical protein
MGSSTNRCRYGLQSGNAAADDEHARGSDGASGGGHHGKELGQRVGADNHGFIAAHGGHGGKRVHRLRASGARHQLDGERIHASAGDFLDYFL